VSLARKREYLDLRKREEMILTKKKCGEGTGTSSPCSTWPGPEVSSNSLSSTEGELQSRGMLEMACKSEEKDMCY
jgi:hypothetical protein